MYQEMEDAGGYGNRRGIFLADVGQGLAITVYTVSCKDMHRMWKRVDVLIGE